MIKHTNQGAKTQVKVFYCLILFDSLESKGEYYLKRKGSHHSKVIDERENDEGQLSDRR